MPKELEYLLRILSCYGLSRGGHLKEQGCHHKSGDKNITLNNFVFATSFDNIQRDNLTEISQRYPMQNRNQAISGKSGGEINTQSLSETG